MPHPISHTTVTRTNRLESATQNRSRKYFFSNDMTSRSTRGSSGGTLLSPKYEEFNKLIPETLHRRPSASRLPLVPTHQLHHSMSSFQERRSKHDIKMQHQQQRHSASSLRNVSTQSQKMRGYYHNKRRGRPGHESYSDEGSIASAPISSMQQSFSVGRGRTKTRSEQARDESPVSRNSSSLETVRKLSPSEGGVVSRKPTTLQDIRKVIDGKFGWNELQAKTHLDGFLQDFSRFYV